MTSSPGRRWLRPFSGSFDGSGHTISNFTCTYPEEYIRLFGYIDEPNGVTVIKEMSLTIDSKIMQSG